MASDLPTMFAATSPGTGQRSANGIANPIVVYRRTASAALPAVGEPSHGRQEGSLDEVVWASTRSAR